MNDLAKLLIYSPIFFISCNEIQSGAAVKKKQ